MMVDAEEGCGGMTVRLYRVSSQSVLLCIIHCVREKQICHWIEWRNVVLISVHLLMCVVIYVHINVYDGRQRSRMIASPC